MKGTGISINNDTLDINIATSGAYHTFLIEKTMYQDQAFILRAHAGEIKEKPTLGAGLSDIAMDNDRLAWRKRIRQQLESEGFNIKDLRFNGINQLEIDAEYNS
ncbi:MAG: hypothetical protein LUG18_15210 [Candidatus Azobacteroides sp.]|nr:hypothetical protein [Candidatus Azobacteroides sp.]